MQKTGISLSRFSVMRLQLTVAMSSAAVPEMRDKSVKTKPFSEMPGPRGLPFVGNLFSLPSQVKDDELLLRTSRMFEKYGPIYKVKFGPFQMVNLSEVNAVEKVHRMEGKYPRRLTVGSWKAWRAEHNLKDGIIIG